MYFTLGVRANLFGCKKIDSEARRGGKRHRVSQSKLCVSCEVCAHDHQRSGNGQCQTNPERSVRPPTKNEPCQESNDDRSVVAEQRGVRRVCLKDGSVIKREIERKEKSTGPRLWAMASEAASAITIIRANRGFRFLIYSPLPKPSGWAVR